MAKGTKKSVTEEDKSKGSKRVTRPNPRGEKRKIDLSNLGVATAKQKRKDAASAKKAEVEEQQTAVLEEMLDGEDDTKSANPTELATDRTLESQGKELAELRLIIEGLLTKTEKLEESVASFERKVERAISSQKQGDDETGDAVCEVNVGMMLSEDALRAQLLEKHDKIFIRNFNTDGSNLAVNYFVFHII